MNLSPTLTLSLEKKLNMRTLFIILIFAPLVGYTQDLSQTIRGTVTDKETFEPLIGAKVVVLNSDPLIGGVTDVDGQFRIENVPVGRQSIQVSYIGYEPYVQQNIDITSKDIVLDIRMTESFNMTDEVEIKANKKRRIG